MCITHYLDNIRNGHYLGQSTLSYTLIERLWRASQCKASNYLSDCLTDDHRLIYLIDYVLIDFPSSVDILIPVIFSEEKNFMITLHCYMVLKGWLFLSLPR